MIQGLRVLRLYKFRVLGPRVYELGVWGVGVCVLGWFTSQGFRFRLRQAPHLKPLVKVRV